MELRETRGVFAASAAAFNGAKNSDGGIRLLFSQLWQIGLPGAIFTFPEGGGRIVPGERGLYRARKVYNNIIYCAGWIVCLLRENRWHGVRRRPPRILSPNLHNTDRFRRFIVVQVICTTIPQSYKMYVPRNSVDSYRFRRKQPPFDWRARTSQCQMVLLYGSTLCKSWINTHHGWNLSWKCFVWITFAFIRISWFQLGSVYMVYYDVKTIRRCEYSYV